MMQNPNAKLSDLTKTSIDPELPKRERVQRFVLEVGNPYRFRVGDTIVNVSFSNYSNTLQECLTRLASK